MKKLSILFVAFFIISISLKAQEEVGTYYNNYFKEEFTIEASQKNNKISDIYIEVSAKKSSQSFINIGGDDLETFKASLIALRDKYLSWVKIAKDNNVTEMNKEFDIKFPSVTVAWVGSKWWFDFNRKISMRFLRWWLCGHPKLQLRLMNTLMKLFILLLSVKMILTTCLIS